MHHLRFIVISVLISVAAIYLSHLLYPGSHMFGAVEFPVDKSQLIENAEKLCQSFGISTENFYADIKLRYKNTLIRKVQSEHGLSDGNKILRQSVPGYWWDIWLNSKEAENNPGKSVQQTNDRIVSNVENVHIQYDTHGNLIHFSFTLPDTVVYSHISYLAAKIIAYDFLRINNLTDQVKDTTLVSNDVRVIPDMPHSTNEGKPSRQPDSQDFAKSYDFEWVVADDLAEADLKIKMTISGDKVTEFDRDYDVPDKFRGDDIFHATTEIIVAIALIVISLVIAYRKIRSYEIRFNLAVMLGISLTIFNAIEVYFVASRIGDSEKLLAVLVSSLFLGGIFILIWAVAESVGRETWGDKFIPLDLLTRGYIFHSKIGESILRGITIGVVSFFASLAFTWMFAHFFNLTAFTTDEYIQNVFGSSNPLAMLLSHSYWSNLYVLALNCILVVVLIYNKVQKSQWTIILAAIPMAILYGGKIQPLYIGLLIKIIAYSLIIWGFYRFDILSVFLSLITFKVLDIGLSFVNTADESMHMSAEFSALLFGFLVIYAVYSLYSKDRVTDFREIRPVLAKFISERQRLQQELEIARDVQMSFLPQHLPTIKGLDIAARCIPALEVGGDYYDFVKMSPTRLGVAIGDVSGKGTRAAFYMTLVKGFLKALSLRAKSPAELLKELNSLFFENARRDAFISMVYGIFDVNNHTLVLARSGHNPVIMYRKQDQKMEIIRTNGLALGLEKGELFNKMMQETSIPLSKGDIIVFYTDGFTEAMDKQRQEFGEKRLLEIIKTHSEMSAQNLLNRLFDEVKNYTHGAKQNDDMSAVVIKVI